MRGVRLRRLREHCRERVRTERDSLLWHCGTVARELHVCVAVLCAGVVRPAGVLGARHPRAGSVLWPENGQEREGRGREALSNFAPKVLPARSLAFCGRSKPAGVRRSPVAHAPTTQPHHSLRGLLAAHRQCAPPPRAALLPACSSPTSHAPTHTFSLGPAHSAFALFTLARTHDRSTTRSLSENVLTDQSQISRQAESTCAEAASD